MTKAGYRTILYILVGLLIVVGLGLFLGREQLLDYLRQESNLEALTAAKSLGAASPRETLDTEILESAKFKALKNNISKFDFDNICSRPGGSEVKVLTISGINAAATSSIATSSVTLNCSLGSSNLFFIKNN